LSPNKNISNNTTPILGYTKKNTNKTIGKQRKPYRKNKK
jgi:hypothetical protein